MVTSKNRLRLTIFFTLRPPVRSSLVLAGLRSHSVARLRTQPAKLAVVKNWSLGAIFVCTITEIGSSKIY
jgi:hypothetical protein